MPARSRLHTGLLATLLVSTALPVAATEPPPAPPSSRTVPAAGRHSAIASTFAFGRYAIAATSSRGSPAARRSHGRPGRCAAPWGGGRPSGRLPGPRAGQAAGGGPPSRVARHPLGAPVHRAAYPSHHSWSSTSSSRPSWATSSSAPGGCRSRRAPGGVRGGRPAPRDLRLWRDGSGWRRRARPGGRRAEDGAATAGLPDWSRAWSPALPAHRLRRPRATLAAAARRARSTCAGGPTLPEALRRRYEIGPVGSTVSWCRARRPSSGSSCPRPHRRAGGDRLLGRDALWSASAVTAIDKKTVRRWPS